MSVQQANPDIFLEGFDEETMDISIEGITARRMMQIIMPDPRPCKLLVTVVATPLTRENDHEKLQGPQPGCLDLWSSSEHSPGDRK